MQKAGTEIKVTATDEAGNVSEAQAAMVLDKTSPTVPTLNTVADSSKIISGKTEAKAIVKLYISGTYFKSIGADQEGNYSFSIPMQKAGTEIKVTATDQAGNVSGAKVIKVIDRTAPVIPTLNTVSDNSKTVSGKTEANSTVRLYISGVYNNRTVSDQQGNFSFAIPMQKTGTEIKVTATDQAGNTSEKKQKVIDKTSPALPAVNLIGDNITVITGKVEPFTYCEDLHFGKISKKQDC